MASNGGESADEYSFDEFAANKRKCRKVQAEGSQGAEAEALEERLSRLEKQSASSSRARQRLIWLGEAIPTAVRGLRTSDQGTAHLAAGVLCNLTTEDEEGRKEARKFAAHKEALDAMRRWRGTDAAYASAALVAGMLSDEEVADDVSEEALLEAASMWREGGDEGEGEVSEGESLGRVYAAVLVGSVVRAKPEFGGRVIENFGSADEPREAVTRLRKFQTVVHGERTGERLREVEDSLAKLVE